MGVLRRALAREYRRKAVAGARPALSPEV